MKDFLSLRLQMDKTTDESDFSWNIPWTLSNTRILPVVSNGKELKSPRLISSSQPGLSEPQPCCCNESCSDAHFPLKLTNGQIVFPFLFLKHLCVSLLIRNTDLIREPTSCKE